MTTPGGWLSYPDTRTPLDLMPLIYLTLTTADMKKSLDIKQPIGYNTAS